MFSLIVTVIAIALVAALALATLYYGGTAFNQSSMRAEAAKVVNQGQQLIGAADLYYADHGFWPASMDVLKGESYLQAIPVAELGAVTPAFAGTTAWVMVAPSHPVFSVPGSGIDACRSVNLLASGVNGVPVSAVASWDTQCYGASTGTLLIVTSKNVDELNLVIPATVAAPADCASADWLVAPESCGAAPAGIVVGNLTGDMAFGDQTIGTSSATRYATFTNTGDTILDITGVSISGPFSFTHDCGATLGVGLHCTVSVNFSPIAQGDAPPGQLLISNSGGINMAPLSGFGTLASDSAPPVITSSYFSQHEPFVGASTTFNWSTTDATRVDVQCDDIAVGGGTDLGLSGSITVTAASTGEGYCTVLAFNSVNGFRTGADAIYPVLADYTLDGWSSGFSDAPIGLSNGNSMVGVTNLGNANVTLSATTPVAATAGFAITGSDCTASLVLAPGDSCYTMLIATPLVEGTNNGTLTVYAATGNAVVNLSVTGLPPPVLLSTSLMTFAPTTVLTSSDEQVLTVTNTGWDNVTWGEPVVVGPFYPWQTTCNGVLGQGYSCTYRLFAYPETVGPISGSMTITPSLGAPLVLTLRATGL